MQRKLNEEFIKEYSAQFSEKITSNFFTEKTEITGKEILKVTPSKQVNFFILKILFGKWQEEMKKLESPYFNYRNSEVRRAMVDFMNTLSQHIEVGGDHFITLCEEAVENTITLLVDPARFLDGEFADKKISSVTGKVTKPIFKYIKLHKTSLQDFFEEHEGEETQRFLSEAQSLFQGLDEEVLAEELRVLSAVIPISLNELFADDNEAHEEVLEEEDSDKLSVDEEYLAEEEEPPVRQNEPEDDEPEMSEEDERVEEPPSTFESEEDFEDDGFEDEGDVETESESEGGEEEDADKLDFDGEESVNEQYASNPSTLNDKFNSGEEKQTVADQLEQKKVTNIMEAISVNHRYMFTKELFDGDREAFNQAIEKEEACESFDDAVELLVQNFAKERNWDMNSDEVKELLKMIFRKFR